MENTCGTLIYCLVFQLDYGSRVDGNIGELLPKRNYNTDTPYYIARFFHNFLNFALIWLILFSILFGIVIDTFAELREESQRVELDMKNVCFICGSKKDDLEKENINFYNHTQHDHYIWQYAEYIIGLKYVDPQETNAVNSYVIDMVSQKKISWFPIGRVNDEVIEEDDDDDEHSH
jgi:hypothetical protein